MGIASLGCVLNRMAAYAGNRATVRQAELGQQNVELLYALSHMLAEGAQECLDIAVRDEHDRHTS